MEPLCYDDSPRQILFEVMSSDGKGCTFYKQAYSGIDKLSPVLVYNQAKDFEAITGFCERTPDRFTTDKCFGTVTQTASKKARSDGDFYTNVFDMMMTFAGQENKFKKNNYEPLVKYLNLDDVSKRTTIPTFFILFSFVFRKQKTTLA